jgi:hypothetical protein
MVQVTNESGIRELFRARNKKVVYLQSVIMLTLNPLGSAVDQCMLGGI